jgi:hypothetical protein
LPLQQIKCFLTRNDSAAERRAVEINFGDARLCAVFNSFRSLCDSYGQDVAHSISLRMGVLAAAPTLVAVPRKPPINLRADRGTYSVSLVQARRLRFQSLSQGVSGTAEPEAVTAIEILGVDG